MKRFNLQKEKIMNENIQNIHKEITKVVRGKDTVVDMVLCAMLAGGHILLEDIPGVGKTTLAVALSRAVSLSYKRMQFTPDVLPSDILGFSLYDNKTGEFTYRPGCIFTNLFLADEINRASPKTQSALLEVMEEHKVTVDGVTRQLEEPFFVIATQNPVGASGTQKLPDSQLDRFFVRLSLGYPSHAAATDILKGHSMDQIDVVQPVCSARGFRLMQQKTGEVFCKDELLDYIVKLIEATRGNQWVFQGISPRGSLALLKMARAHAFMEDRDYVVPEDIQEKPEFSSIDVSFISLTKVLGPVRNLLTEDGEIVCLIKPQFEAGREKVGKKGVVRDPAVHEEVIEKVRDFAMSIALEPCHLSFSPIKGPEGNIEYLLHLKKRPEGTKVPDSLTVKVEDVVAQAHGALDKPAAN